MRLEYSFYKRHVVEVAKDLLGKKLVLGNIQGIITETEAYRGFDDEASHAYCGITKRNQVMFGPPGYSYVYMIYGVHYCFNIVSEEQGVPGAVLIRGLQLPEIHLNGPGKLCAQLGITKEHNGINLCESNYMFVEGSTKIHSYLTTRRIGIKKAIEKPWRFILQQSRSKRNT